MKRQLLIASLFGASAVSPVFADPALNYNITTLATFDRTNGANPQSGLIADAYGNFYGDAYGGANGDGVIYKISGDTHAFTPLINFTDADGNGPTWQLALDPSGNLYGTAGASRSGGGVVFQYSPSTNSLSTVVGGAVGGNPQAGLISDPAGNLYGTMSRGGLFDGGTVFEVAAGTHTPSVLTNFDLSGGYSAYAGVTIDAKGNLYGTTVNGGTSNKGTVFKIAAGTSSITTLASFDGTNGASPEASLSVDSSGNIFGTAGSGGKNNAGTVFEIAAGTHCITPLINFNGANGADPQGGLLAVNGSFYGTTFSGGASGVGTVYKLNPNSKALTTVFNFNSSNGANPDTNLTIDAKGNLYGTTFAGGANGLGTVFELTPSINAIPRIQPPSSALTQSPLSDPGQLELFDPNTDQFDLAPSSVNRNEPTIVITHGWKDSPSSWATFAAQIDFYCATHTPVNIVAWDWTTAAHGLGVSWIGAKTPAQGIALATALNSALGGTSYSDAIHFMGHSLGTLVNASAINQFRILNPNNLKIQDTLFDEAEIATGYTVSSIPNVPVAWIDNYISAFGNLHSEAANAILQGGATDVLPANFHSYPQDWYAQTVGGNVIPAFGFQSDITQGGLNGIHPAAGSYYVQNATGNNFTAVIGGALGATLILTARDVIEDFTTAPSAIGYLIADELNSPIQTYNQCQATIAPIRAPLAGTLQGPRITLTKNPYSIDAGGTTPANLLSDSPLATADPQNVTPTSSSYAWVSLTIPANAQYLSLDFICHDLSANDFFSLGIEDTPLFEVENQFVADNTVTNTGFLDVSQWAGQDVELFLGLNASDDNNTGGTIVVDDIEFSSVPEPSSMCQTIIIATCFVGRRKVHRRFFK